MHLGKLPPLLQCFLTTVQHRDRRPSCLDPCEPNGATASCSVFGGTRVAFFNASLVLVCCSSCAGVVSCSRWSFLCCFKEATLRSTCRTLTKTRQKVRRVTWHDPVPKQHHACRGFTAGSPKKWRTIFFCEVSAEFLKFVCFHVLGDARSWLKLRKVKSSRSTRHMVCTLRRVASESQGEFSNDDVKSVVKPSFQYVVMNAFAPIKHQHLPPHGPIMQNFLPSLSEKKDARPKRLGRVPETPVHDGPSPRKGIKRVRWFQRC